MTNAIIEEEVPKKILLPVSDSLKAKLDQKQRRWSSEWHTKENVIRRSVRILAAGPRATRGSETRRSWCAYFVLEQTQNHSNEQN